MRIVIAPDSYKGSLSAADVARALADGWRRVRPRDVVVLSPVADGGEGTLDALVSAWNGRVVEAIVTGPVGAPVKARFGVSSDGRTAVVEMAEASGLTLVPDGQMDPKATTTFGTGELLRAALDFGVERIVVAVGGSGTNDGGAGMARALGLRLLDDREAPLPEGGAALRRLARIDATDLDPRVARVQFVVAADVTNPLTGPQGASAVFGPQKGATPEDVVELDDALHHYADVVERAAAEGRLGLPPRTVRRDMPGTGAAGGLAFGLVAFCGAEIWSGADVVLDALDFDGLLEGADLVMTGEGRLDGQSVHGKAPVAVARRARAMGKPAVAVAGMLGLGWEKLYEHGVTAALSIAPGPIRVEDSMQGAESLLRDCGERVARLVSVGVDSVAPIYNEKR